MLNMHIHTHKHDKIHETPQRRIKNNKTYTHKPKKTTQKNNKYHN